jgi:hypothetical protein
MSNDIFAPTAYTVKDPGNGQQRRYDAENSLYSYRRAQEMWMTVSSSYPLLARGIVPDHFVQEYCRRCDVASGGGSYGPGESAPAEIMLKLLEQSGEAGGLNFLDQKV